MKLRHFIFGIPLALLVYGLYLGVVVPEERAKVIRLAHGLPPDHPVHQAMAFMAKDLAERSGGTLRLMIYPSEQLGPEREAIEMLQVGSLAMTKVSTAPLENFSPKMSIFSLPYLFRDGDHFWKVLDGPIGDELLDASLSYRLKGLCYYDAGARSFYINKKRGKAVRTPDDLRGMSIRTQKSRSAVRLLEVLGVNAVPIAWGELYSALDTGTVDGAENNPPSLHTSKQFEVSHSYCLDEHTRVPDILLMSADAWERLAPAQRDWVRASARESSRHQRTLWHAAEAEAFKAIEAAGVQVVRDVDQKAFRARAEAMYQDPEFRKPEIQDLIRRIGETR
jgi:tripartite ATP-independent transporter DctP family solute receptor